MSNTRIRGGVTLLELIIVLAIIGVMVGLLLPAVLSAHEKANETVCKNNVHQIALAMAQFAEATKKLPAADTAGLAGGWSVEILPFLEQRALLDQIGARTPLTSVPTVAYLRPAAMRCPSTTVGMSNVPGIEASHFVMSTNTRRDFFLISDAPLGNDQPWLAGPEIGAAALLNLTGPHRGGFHQASWDASVHYLKR
jgi:prepilin-type N-terminal cleavage/methylation domain-containing protein